MNYYTNGITKNELTTLASFLDFSLPEMQPLTILPSKVKGVNSVQEVPVSTLIVHSDIFTSVSSMRQLCSLFDFSKKPLKIVILEKSKSRTSKFYRVPLSWIASELRQKGIEQLVALAESDIYYLGKQMEEPYLKHLNPVHIKLKISYNDLLKTHQQSSEVSL